MFLKTLKPILGGCAALAATFGLSLAGAHAQPYDNDDTAYTTGGITVYARPYYGRTFSGAPIVRARVTRVVDTSDLDLSTGHGVRVLRDRVERAAADACNELDNQYTMGLYPMPDENDTDCIRRATDDAMYQAGL